MNAIDVKKMVLVMLLASSCAGTPYLYSSRDITPEEKIELASGVTQLSERSPANWFNSCVSSVGSFFKPKPAVSEYGPLLPLPELAQLNPVAKNFSNGKKYTEYTANINVMNKYPDYDQFLEETAEVIFEPVDPFGHIVLRIGKKTFAFNNVQWTAVRNFSPEMNPSSKPEELMHSHGFVFQLGKQKIEALKKDIELFYSSSSSHNIPAFDAYSPLLKIEEREAGVTGGKKLFYVTDSPKYGNSRELTGSIVEKEGKMVLDAGNGVIVPVVKKGNDYYTQSYSCSSSAGHVLEKFFGIKISHAYSAKSLAQSLMKGNINESHSPVAVIKYYEE